MPLAAFCWGGIGPVSRYAFSQGMAPLEVAYWRAFFGWIIFGLLAVRMKQTRVRRRDLPWVLSFGLWGVSLFYGSYLLAIEHGGAALAAVLLYTAPLWVAVLGWGLLAGFLYGIYFIFGKRFLRSYATPTLFLYALPVGMLGLAPFIRVEFPPPRARSRTSFLGSPPLQAEKNVSQGSGHDDEDRGHDDGDGERPVQGIVPACGHEDQPGHEGEHAETEDPHQDNCQVLRYAYPARRLHLILPCRQYGPARHPWPTDPEGSC